MQRVKRSTAAAAMPAPPVGGTAGFFAKPDPAGGVAATVPGYEWYNNVQEELVGLILAAGLALSDADTTQLVQAVIKKGMQAGIFSYAVDTGVANTYQVAFSPAITALTDGMVLRFKAKTANTGASTFNPNGMGTSPIWGADHAALGGGEIVANGDVWVQWNSSLNGGNGAWVLVDSTGGYIKTPNAPQFDNSQKLATTAAVKAAGFRHAATVVISSATVLDATYAGKVVCFSGTTPYTVTLPSRSVFPDGETISFWSSNPSVVTIARAGADTIYPNNAGVTSVAMGNGDTLTLESATGVGGWVGVGGSALSAIGVGQTWNDYTASRALNTSYTNTSSKPIMVSVSVTNSVSSSTCSLGLTVNGITGVGLTSRVAGTAGNDVLNAIAIVPPGGTYLAATTQANLNKWTELK